MSICDRRKRICYQISTKIINYLNKKEYRRRAILRWKDKVIKKRGRSTRQPILRPKNNSRKNILSSIVSGRDLLKSIPSAADCLPAVADCPHCGALKFYSETLDFCCLNGRVVLSNNVLPVVMQELLTSMSDEAKAFRTYIRTYSNHFAFTSLGVTSDLKFNKRDNGIYTFRVQGQVAAIWVESEENEEYGPRDIEVQTHSCQTKNIQYFYGCYDPLQYPLMFPFGELGWHQGILKKKNFYDHTGYSSVSASIANVESLLQLEENVLARNAESTRLLQQYIVDNFVKLETQRLDFYRTQQQEIRQEFRQGIVDAMASGETDGSAVGNRIVLPSNFIGGPRNM